MYLNAGTYMIIRFFQRNTKFYSFTQTVICFFTAKYEILQFYPKGHSFVLQQNTKFYGCTQKAIYFLSLLNYAPSFLACLRALRALIFTRLNYALCAPYFKYIYDVCVYIYIDQTCLHKKNPLLWRITDYQLLFAVICSYLATLLDFSMIISFIGPFLLVIVLFLFVLFLKPNWNELIIMIMMINITIIDTYPLK